jgi:predicted RNA-binding Zn-ribbon protein involved in translation (DUF1610 family)
VSKNNKKVVCPKCEREVSVDFSVFSGMSFTCPQCGTDWLIDIHVVHPQEFWDHFQVEPDDMPNGMG